MFKWYGDITKMSEKDMSRASLMRMRLYVIMSLPAMPLVGLWKLGLIPSGTGKLICGLVLFVSVIALLILMISRFAYRLWVPDKYLDEWEVRIKHQSMASGFQVVMYTVAIIAGVFIGSGGFDDAVLSNMTQFGAIYGLFAVLALGQYAQYFAQLALMRPIDEDEFDDSRSKKRSMRGAVLGALAIFGLFMMPVMMQVVQGYNVAHEVAVLSGKAKKECEARSSSVAWVSSADDGDFACFDENRPKPANANGKENE